LCPPRGENDGMLRLLGNDGNRRSVEKMIFLGRPATFNGLEIFVF
jgi:hypothetical protein